LGKLPKLVRAPILALSLLCLGAFTSCAGPEGTESIEEADQAFKLLGGSFLSAVTNFPENRGFVVCLHGTDVTSANKASKQAMIKQALLTWVDGVRQASKINLITSSNFSFRDGIASSIPACNIDVQWDTAVDPNASAHADTGNGAYAWTVLYSDNSYTTVLHEAGHMCGLHDTYLRSGGCQSGEPSSVMCGAASDTLFSDDIIGIRESFRTAYPDAIDLPFEMQWHLSNSGMLM
jgi:hypothetical protein